MTSGFKKRGDARQERPQLFEMKEPKRERARLYQAIVFLRAQGLVIQRVSAAQSRIDGKLYTNAELARLARRRGFE